MFGKSNAGNFQFLFSHRLKCSDPFSSTARSSWPLRLREKEEIEIPIPAGYKAHPIALIMKEAELRDSSSPPGALRLGYFYC